MVASILDGVEAIFLEEQANAGTGIRAEDVFSKPRD